MNTITELKNPTGISFGYETFIVERDVAIKLLEVMSDGPLIFKLDSSYDSETKTYYPKIGPADPSAFKINVLTHGYVMWGRQNFESASKG